MKAPFAYYGGKSGMANLIIGLMPPHRVYIEPFFGSGAVLFAKTPTAHEIVNDLDGGIVAFFRCLRDRPEELIRACELTPYARDEYTAAISEPHSDDDLERARRFWVAVNQSFSKTAGRQTGWSMSTVRTQSPPASVASRVDRFAACAARLRTVTIERCDAAGLVSRLATGDSVVYADPPYLASTRRPRVNGEADDYRHDMGSDAEHARLAEVLRATPAAVIVSGYRSPLYDELYGDWWSLDIPVTVHSSNARTSSRDGRVETLWSNRDLTAGRLTFDHQPNTEAAS